MTLANATKYAVVTHWMVAIDVPYSRPSVGRATLTMVASRTVMIAPSTTTAASVRISRVSTGASAGSCDTTCFTGSVSCVAELVMERTYSRSKVWSASFFWILDSCCYTAGHGGRARTEGTQEA